MPGLQPQVMEEPRAVFHMPSYAANEANTANTATLTSRLMSIAYFPNVNNTNRVTGECVHLILISCLRFCFRVEGDLGGDGED